jgi:hypothetical protein
MPPKSPNKSGRFGKPIQFKNYPPKSKTGAASDANRQGANAMVSQYLNVKKNYKERLRTMTEGDIHAFRFYCENDCAFIFDLDIMQALINAVNREKGKSKKEALVVLFQGLKKTHLGAEKGCAFGLPTMIAAAYVKSKKDTYVHVPIKEDDLPVEYVKDDGDVDPPFDGFQHPGNGNSGSFKFTDEGFVEVKANAAKPPTVVRHASNDEADTDFTIEPNLNVSVFNNWIK